MNRSDAERIVQSVLLNSVEQHNQAAKRLGAAIANGQREATEITRLEAARRERIEAESTARVSATQAKSLQQRPQLERPFSPPRQGIRPADQVERLAASINPREQPLARQAFAAPPPPNQDNAKYHGGIERSDQTAVRAAMPEKARQQLEVKARREYIVKVEEDVDQLVDRIAEQINTQMAAREQVIMWRLNQRLIEWKRNNRQTFG